MTYTGSGAREKRKAAATALSGAESKVTDLTQRLQGRSGLSQAQKVENLDAAFTLATGLYETFAEVADQLEDAVAAARNVSDVGESNTDSDSGSKVETAVRALVAALREELS